MSEKKTCTFKATSIKGDIEHMAKALAAMGVEIECKVSGSGRSAELAVTVPENVYDAKVSRTRNAGRPRNLIQPPSDSPFTPDTTCAEFVAWLDDGGHTVEEAMHVLGIKSRATYYRRIKVIREKAAWAARVNPSRKAKGLPPARPTLKSTSNRN